MNRINELFFVVTITEQPDKSPTIIVRCFILAKALFLINILFSK